MVVKSCFRRMAFGALPAALALAVSARDLTFEEAFPAKELRVPLTKLEKCFYPKDNKANFTNFSGVQNAVVENDVLKFALAADTAVLGWGNYQGKQPLAEIVDLWEERNDIELDIRQSGARSEWTARYYADGKPLPNLRNRPREPLKAALVGDKRQTLKFGGGPKQVPTPDGLEFVMKGKKGDRFEIKRVTAVRPTLEGYFAKTFELPENDPVWQARLNIAGRPNGVFYDNNRLVENVFINGRELAWRGQKSPWHADNVDIAPYLKPGKNRVAVYCYGAPPNGPVLYLKSSVVLRSGKIVEVATDDTWKYSGKEEKNWEKADFDDTAWARANAVAVNPNFRKQSYWDGTVNIPEYQGRLKIVNPSKKDLFYSDDIPVVFDVLIPAGYKEKNPTVSYAIDKADRTGAGTAIDKGTLTAYDAKNDSLTFRLNAGKLEGGVYVLSLSLVVDGNVIEERPREPFMVIRRLDQRIVSGTDFTDGLALELEDEIDFASVDTSRPWFESKAGMPKMPAEKVDKPKIVQKNGLTYRESAEGAGSNISYRLNHFKYPGDFYLVELEYPDDAERDFDVVIASKIKGSGTNCQAGAGVATGGNYYLTNRFQTLRFLFVADSGVHSLDIVNCAENDTFAAARSAKIYHVKGALPAIKAGKGRTFGTFCERCYYTSGHGMNFGLDQPRSVEDILKDEKELTLTRRFIENLVWSWETADKYTQYLKFAGQNAHVIGSYQYTITNTGIVLPSLTDTSRLPQCFRRVLANTFTVNDIDFYAGVEFFWLPEAPTFANNAQVAKGADSVWRVNAKGEQAYPFLNRAVMNWVHPKAKEGFKKIVSELAATYDSPNFKGVQLFLGVPDLFSEYKGDVTYDANDNIYDDYAFSKFLTDTGVACSIDPKDPGRFAKRAAFLSAPDMKKRYYAWRSGEAIRLVQDALAALKQRAPNARVLCALAGGVNTGTVERWRAAGVPLGEFFSRFSIDPELFKKTKDVSLFRWTTSWSHYDGLAHRKPENWESARNKEMIDAFNADTDRGVFIAVSQDELSTASPGHVTRGTAGGTLVESDWILDTYKIRANPQPSDVCARAAFIDALIASDPETVIFGFTDINLPIGHEQESRKFAEVFTRLPKEKFQPVLNTGRSADLAIRQLKGKNESWFYLVNPGFWGVKGTVTLKTTGKVTDLTTGETVPLSARSTLPIALDPYSVAAYRVDAPDLEIAAYAVNAVDDSAQTFIGAMAEKFKTLLAAPWAMSLISAAEKASAGKTLASADAALKATRYAEAWAFITDPKFRGVLAKLEIMNSQRDKGLFIDKGWEVSRRLEKPATLKAAACVKLSDKTLDWRPIAPDFPGRINVNPIFKGQDGMVYLGVKIDVPKPLPLTVLFGHDGGAKLFINGKALACSPDYYPSISYPRNRVPIVLKQGVHEVIVALDLDSGRGWGVKLQFGSQNGARYRVLDFPNAAAE